MLKKFCLALLVVAVAFVSTTETSSAAFNATTMTNATMAPVPFNEDLPSQTSSTTVSIDFSFNIHPDAMDLIQTVFANFHDLYKNCIVPVALDLSEFVSTEREELYQAYQPLAMDRFHTIWAELYKNYPETMDLIVSVATHAHELYQKYEPLALELADTVWKASRDFYVQYQPVAVDVLKTMFIKCHGIYKKYLLPLAMDVIAIVSAKCQELFEKYLPLLMDLLVKVSFEIYDTFEACWSKSSSSYALFDYGRVEMMALLCHSILNHSISFNQTALAPLVFTNVSGVGIVDEIMVDFGSSSILQIRDSKNMTTFVHDDVDSKHDMYRIQSAEMVANVTSSFSLEESKKNLTSTVVCVNSNNSTTAHTQNMTASQGFKCSFMIYRDNATPTFATATTASDSLLEDFQDVIDKFRKEWEVFYNECNSFLSSWSIAITTFAKDLKRTAWKATLGLLLQALGLAIVALVSEMQKAIEQRQRLKREAMVHRSMYVNCHHKVENRRQRISRKQGQGLHQAMVY